MEKQKKTVTIPTIDTEQADSVFDFKAKLSLLSLMVPLLGLLQMQPSVMKAELLVKDQTSMMTKLVQLDYNSDYCWHHETNSADGTKRRNLGAHALARLTDEAKKKTTVTACFYSTGLDIQGYVDQSWYLQKVFSRW